MAKYNSNEKYMKLIECIGEILLNKDETIKFNQYEIENLKKQIERTENYMEYYAQPTEDIIENDYQEASKRLLKQNI